VAGGRDVGAATTFSRESDDQTLTFVLEDDKIVDEQTGTEWDVLGQGVSGSLSGRQLEPVVSINHFWFSWAAFRPDTRVYSAEDGEPVTVAPAPSPAGADLELAADFAISMYQGGDVLGGESILFSDAFVQGKPVVLSLWAGLCPVCRIEMPELEQAYAEYGDQVLFIGLDVGPFVGLGSQEDGLALLDELEITYPAGTTSDATMMRAYRALGTPATYFLKPNGEIVEQWNGLLTGEQLQDKIKTLLDASGDA
jgi:thiol-disulfide isomerase/thioredoxin